MSPDDRERQGTQERVALTARDVMLAQVEQRYVSATDKQALAQYLQQALQDYIDRDCKVPNYGEPFPAKAPSVVTSDGGADHDDKKTGILHGCAMVE